MTLFLPKNFPQQLSIWYYSFGHNDTHVAIPLDYGSLLNHHESANTFHNNDIHFQVRGFFQCANHNVQKYAHAHACIHTRKTYMHNRCMYAHNIFKATEDIAIGQELFYFYGPQWFEIKNLPYTDIDYASTKWRPALQPLPCRKDVIQTTGADGRRNYAVREAVPLGAILEVSLCLEMPIVVVDQFPYLWDFVLTRETDNVHAN